MLDFIVLGELDLLPNGRLSSTRSGFKLPVTVTLARAIWHHRETISTA